MLYRIRKDLANQIRSPKLWVGLLIGLAGYFVQFANLLKLVRGSDYGVNIFETYALGSTNSWAMTVSAAGLVFALSDMPYLSLFEMNAIYRSSKRRRITEKFLFSAVCTAVYFVLQFAITVIITLPISFTENAWSFFSFAISGAAKSSFSPAAAALFSLFLNFMYGLMLISILFFLSLLLDKGIAFAVILTFQAIQHFLMVRLPQFSYFCLFRNSILNYHGQISKELIVHLLIEFAVICAALAASVAIRNKISYDVRQEENNLL